MKVTNPSRVDNYSQYMHESISRKSLFYVSIELRFRIHSKIHHQRVTVSLNPDDTKEGQRSEAKR